MQLYPSALADVFKRDATQDIEGAKKAMITSLQQSYAQIFGKNIINYSCEIDGLGEGDNFTTITVFDIESCAVFNSGDNVWTITFIPMTVEIAQDRIDSTKTSQNIIRALASDAQLQSTAVMNIILPEGAQIINGIEFENKIRYENRGGGSYQQSTSRVGTINGQATVVLTSESLLLASPEITITPAELASANPGLQIRYTGVPPPPGPDYLLYIGVGVTAVAVLAAIILVKRRGGGLPKTPSDKGWAF